MSLLYYNALYNNKNKAYAVHKASKRQLDKFEDYLNFAIKVQEEKRISAKWKKVDEGIRISIEPLFNLIEILDDESIVFEWRGNWFQVLEYKGDQIDFNKEIKFFAHQRNSGVLEMDRIHITSDNNLFINLDFIPDEGEAIVWDEKFIKLKKVDLNNEEVEFKTGTGNKLDILDMDYNEENNIYKVNFEGRLEDGDSILINGFEIKNWEFKGNDDRIDRIFDATGKELKVLIRDGNKIYIKGEVTENLSLKPNEFPIKFKVKDIKIPGSLNYNGNKIQINKDKDGYKIYGNIASGKKQIILEDSSSLEYQLKFIKNRSDNTKLWIELIDEDDSNGNYSAFSKIDLFFDDGVSELKDHRPYHLADIFKIKYRVPDENKLLLEHKNNKLLNYEDLPEELYININTYQLKKQKQAMHVLKTRPLQDQKGLLALTEMKKQYSLWERFEPGTIDEWFFLTDEDRGGNEKQREFVRKSVATPDFTLLEGPPGSGKTTAIMELIAQLIKDGKRVLLAASTHVAVDNVLERLDEAGKIEELGILPLRIGNKGRVEDSVVQFQKDEMVKDNSEYEEMIIESANLVCGTSIGILQHELFKKQDGWTEPIIPHYDYLIIDEASKTTFQEFLVPALYAKRWVLVGDIKQLSPYMEQEDIAANLKRGISRFTPSHRKACLILFNYVYNYKKGCNGAKLCIVDKTEVTNKIKKEINKRFRSFDSNKSENHPNIVFLEKRPNTVKKTDFYCEVSLEDIDQGKSKAWILPTADLLFIKESELDEVKDYIPANMLVINREDWDIESQQYQMRNYYDHYNGELFYREQYKHKKEKKPNKIIHMNNEFLKEKSWATEIAWRLKRIHELRFSNKDIGWAKKHLSLLIPAVGRDKVIKKLEVVKDIALPSILESLQKGVGKNRESDEATVLNSGFDDKDKDPRYECLDFQHRMHPDISSCSREQFYNSKALKDSNKLDREWSYKRYSSRSVWINVNGRTDKNYNYKEADRLIEELEHFVHWAKDTPKPDGKPWRVACLSFYSGQVRKIKDKLRKYTGNPRKNSRFKKDGVEILLYVVDKFQGREADIVFISMVQTFRDGFMDSPNRLNVALTRARYQRVIIGKKNYFLGSDSDALKHLANIHKKKVSKDIYSV